MGIKYDFADLEAFLAVYETGSFHTASRHLNLSQSAVTRRVQKLENALDSSLFDRTTRKVLPTLAAKRLQPRAEAILEEADEAARVLRDESLASDRQRRSLVTVAVLPTLMGNLVAPAMISFRAATPHARVRFLDAAANEVADAVLSGEADFGVGAYPVSEPAMTFEALYRDRIVAALPARHRLASKDTVIWADLAAETLILPARGTGNRMLIDDAIARGRGGLVWTYEASRSTTALALVADGDGVAILPASALHGASDNKVTFRVLHAPQVARQTGLLSRASHQDTPAVSALKSAIRGRARQLALARAPGGPQ